MIASDKIKYYEQSRDMTEYMASFWNGEAVAKIRSQREQDEQHAFASNEEFEKQVSTGAFKESPIVKSIIEKRNAMEQDRSLRTRPGTSTKGSVDLSSLAKLIKNRIE